MPIHLIFADLKTVDVFNEVCYLQLVYDVGLAMVNSKHSFCICIAAGSANGNPETDREL